MKTISVVIPCYNEEKSIWEMYHRLKKIFEEELTQYDYEIIYVDDFSKDNTRVEIEKLCTEDEKVKAVFNAKNFGFDRNVFQSYQYATGDCAFMLFGDLQDPPEMLPEFVKKWEEGYKCIVGQRKRSDENHFMYGLRRLYYKVVDTLSDTKQIETVVLLSHKKADSYIHIDVEFGEGEGKIPVDSIAKRAEAYKPKEKVTYKMIKEYIEAKYGFKVHTAYIAEVKRNLGLPMYDAPNAVEELKQPRKHPTPEKVEAIKDALRYFAVI